MIHEHEIEIIIFLGPRLVFANFPMGYAVRHSLIKMFNLLIRSPYKTDLVKEALRVFGPYYGRELDKSQNIG